MTRLQLESLRWIAIETLVAFVGFLGIRVYLLREVAMRGHATDTMLSVLSDVEIHTLAFRAGYDLAMVPLIGCLAILFRFSTKRHLSGAVIGMLAAAIISIGMVFYPALVLSGRVKSPFTDGLSQSVAYGAFVMILFALLIAGLELLRSGESRGHTHI